MPKENIQVIQFDVVDGPNIGKTIREYLCERKLQHDIDLPISIKYAYIIIDKRDKKCDHIIITIFYRKLNDTFNTMDTIYLFSDNKRITESVIPTNCIDCWDRIYDEPTSPCLIWEE